MCVRLTRMAPHHAESKRGHSPEALIEQVKAEREQDFAAFGVNFDHFHSTPQKKTEC